MTVYWVTGVVVLGVLLFWLHWVCAGLLLAAGGALTVWGMKRSAGMVGLGTTNASIVTCVEPFTVATLAELTLVPGKSFPGVQISQVPNPYGVRARVGMKLPTVCNYSFHNGTDERWGEIFPHPIAAVTADEEALENATRRIPPTEWVVLENAIKMISDLKTEKMHLIPPSKAMDQRSEEFLAFYRRQSGEF